MNNLSREEVIQCRTHFFKEIIDVLNIKPSKMDEILNQKQYYIAPSMDNSFYTHNDCVIKIKGEFNNKEFELWYSLWQYSDILKIGISLSNPVIQGAFIQDNNTNEEIKTLWMSETVKEKINLIVDANSLEILEQIDIVLNNKKYVEPRIDLNYDSILYEWEFVVPDLLESYVKQEKFIIGIRHMHFRVLKLIFDYLNLNNE